MDETETKSEGSAYLDVWLTVSNSRCCTFISVCNQPLRPTQPSILPWSEEPRLGWKRQVWFIPVSGWTRGVQVKLWDPLRMCAILDRLRGVFTTRRRRYTIRRLPLPYAHKYTHSQCCLMYLKPDHKHCLSFVLSSVWTSVFVGVHVPITSDRMYCKLQWSVVNSSESSVIRFMLFCTVG